MGKTKNVSDKNRFFIIIKEIVGKICLYKFDFST